MKEYTIYNLNNKEPYEYIKSLEPLQIAYHR